MLNQVLGGAAVLAALTLAPAASAATVDISYTGSLVISSGLYNGPITVTLAGETDSADVLNNDNTVAVSNVEASTSLGNFAFPDLAFTYENGLLDLYAGTSLLAGFSLDYGSVATDLTSYASINGTVTQSGATINLPATGVFGIHGGSGTFTARLAPDAAVPEPASWAMMIAGFGLVGSALRRNKTSALTA